MRAAVFALLFAISTCGRCGAGTSDSRDSAPLNLRLPDAEPDYEFARFRVRGRWCFPSPETSAVEREYDAKLTSHPENRQFLKAEKELNVSGTMYELTVTGDTLVLRLHETLVERRRYVAVEGDHLHVTLRAWPDGAQDGSELLDFTISEDGVYASSPQFSKRFAIERLVRVYNQ